MEHEKRNKLFCDTSVLVSLFNTKDSLHDKAASLITNVIDQKYIIYFSNYVFLELATILSQKLGRLDGIKACMSILHVPYMQELFIDQKLHEQTWKIFQSIEKKNMGFVDCSHLAVMQAESISAILTFDESDFKPLQKKYGFHLYKQ